MVKLYGMTCTHDPLPQLCTSLNHLGRYALSVVESPVALHPGSPPTQYLVNACDLLGSGVLTLSYTK